MAMLISITLIYKHIYVTIMINNNKQSLCVTNVYMVYLLRDTRTILPEMKRVVLTTFFSVRNLEWNLESESLKNIYHIENDC